jgi:voltage-gated potassium channel
MFVHQVVLQAAEKQICCGFEIHSLAYSCGTHITLCVSLLASTRFSVTCLAVLLVALTLWLQCVGIAALIAWTRSVTATNIHNLGPFRSGALIVRLSAAMIAWQGLMILLWASCYRWLCLPSWESAFYFSASSYATVGYGDVVLPSNWRMLGPLESIIGVLMCGISVSLLFAMMTRLISREAPFSHK